MHRFLAPLALCALFGCAGEEPSRIDDILALSGDAGAGADVYAAQCAACHAADGSGGAAYPDLTVSVPEMSDADVLSTVLDGQGVMIPYDFLSDQDLADLLAHLNTL